jgi:hypothetical protein
MSRPERPGAPRLLASGQLQEETMNQQIRTELQHNRERLARDVRAVVDDAEQLLRVGAHLVGPAILLLDLFVPDEAAHPPGAPVVEVSTRALADGTQIAHRSETVIEMSRRRSIVRSRFEQRDRGGVLAREDDVREITWYAEDEIVVLVRDAGYRDVRVEALPWRDSTRARHFAVSARV